MYTTMCVWLTSCTPATASSAQPLTRATAYSLVQSHWQCKLLPGHAKRVQASCSAHRRVWQGAALLGSGYAPTDRHSVLLDAHHVRTGGVHVMQRVVRSPGTRNPN